MKSRHTLEVGYLDKSYLLLLTLTYSHVLSEGNENSPDHCYGPVIRTL